jgi:hypothetical protein
MEGDAWFHHYSKPIIVHEIYKFFIYFLKYISEITLAFEDDGPKGPPSSKVMGH